MSQEYLRIARDFMKEVTVTPTSSEANKRSSKSVTPERPEQPSDTGYEINEISHSVGARVTLERPLVGEPHEGAVGTTHEAESDVPDGIPPLQPVIASQEQLSMVDCRSGLRCGISGRQCLLCKGVPCLGSTAWRSPHSSRETE